MTGYLTLYILINIFCTVLVLIYAFHSRIGLGAMVVQRCFSITILFLAIFFISDTVWYMMDCKAIPQIYFVSMILKSIYFLSSTLAGYVWFIFITALVRPHYLEKKRYLYFCSIVVALHVICLVVNFFDPILFGLTDKFVYFRGPLFSLQYLFVYTYLIAASALALYAATRPENYIDRSRYIIISLFPVLPAISGMLQFFYWRIPFNCMAFALGITIVYLTELGQQISQEPLTQLANRKQFMRVLQQFP